MKNTIKKTNNKINYSIDLNKNKKDFLNISYNEKIFKRLIKKRLKKENIKILYYKESCIDNNYILFYGDFKYKNMIFKNIYIGEKMVFFPLDNKFNNKKELNSKEKIILKEYSKKYIKICLESYNELKKIYQENFYFFQKYIDLYSIKILKKNNIQIGYFKHNFIDIENKKGVFIGKYFFKNLCFYIFLNDKNKLEIDLKQNILLKEYSKNFKELNNLIIEIEQQINKEIQKHYKKLYSKNGINYFQELLKNILKNEKNKTSFFINFLKYTHELDFLL